MPSPAFNVQTHVIQEKPIRAGASLRSLILGLCYCSIQLLRASPSSRVALCTWVSPDTPSSPRRNNNHHRTTLGIASQIYVISLRRRQYRREAFDVFRVALGPAWTYFDATDTSDPAIARIMANVRTQRDQNPASMTELLFRWPGGIDAVVSSSEVIGAAESDLWAFSAPASADDSAEGFVVNSSSPETSAIPLYTPGPPGYNILTASELACWHSHLGVIHLVANSPEHNATVVLEDDVDMGRDIHERLERVWDAVPAGWDIVFLGHCWSNESHHPALKTISTPSTQIALHPSYAPKCTHAYVLSRSGARRALLHLRHAPFAYSLAIDLALAWLVRSGRLRAHSVVPSVIVQRKVDESDISSGMDGRWSDGLVRGVFGMGS